MGGPGCPRQTFLRLSVLSFLVVLVFLSRNVGSSRLDVEGAGSPCYEVDADGKEDLNKPQVGPSNPLQLPKGAKLIILSLF